MARTPVDSDDAAIGGTLVDSDDGRGGETAADADEGFAAGGDAMGSGSSHQTTSQSETGAGQTNSSTASKASAGVDLWTASNFASNYRIGERPLCNQIPRVSRAIGAQPRNPRIRLATLARGILKPEER